jgi:hypothetical protein
VEVLHAVLVSWLWGRPSHLQQRSAWFPRRLTWGFRLTEVLDHNIYHGEKDPRPEGKEVVPVEASSSQRLPSCEESQRDDGAPNRVLGSTFNDRRTGV